MPQSLRSSYSQPRTDAGKSATTAQLLRRAAQVRCLRGAGAQGRAASSTAMSSLSRCAASCCASEPRLTFACRQPPGTVNLAVGHPTPSLLPHAVLAAAAESAAARLRDGNAAFPLGYGRIAGERPLTEALSAWLTARGGANEAEVRADRLFVSGGVSHSLELLCTALTRPGDAVVVVRPTYFLAFGIFRQHGLRVHNVPSDDEGLNLTALEELLRTVQPRLLYVVPSHANPTGCTLPEAKRRALVELARRHGLFILADEVYDELSWDNEQPARMRHWDMQGAPADDELFGGEDRPLDASADDGAPLRPSLGGHVIHTSSFTKIMAPGLRLGWLEAHVSVLRRLAQRAFLVSGGGVAPFTSLVVLEAIRSGGLDACVTRLVDTYRRRCALLCQALQASAASTGWQFKPPSGGYFLWLRLPDDVPAAALLAAARERGVGVLDGARCCGAGGAADVPLTGGVADTRQHVRLCFAYLEEAELLEGAARLAAALADARAAKRRLSPL